jgi:ATP-dependent DNA helicase RecQ
MLASYALYQTGINLDQIAKRRSLTSNTIEDHLLKCLEAGLEVDIGRFVSLHDRMLIEGAIEEHGVKSLRSLKDELPATISYGMIRFVVAEHRRVKKAG